jgi:putative transposase
MPRHKHMRRLDAVWVETPIYFITLCTVGRRPILAQPAAFAILRAEFEGAPSRYGWSVGRFVVMPDHLHFFCAEGGTVAPTSLSRFIGGFRQWTSKGMARRQIAEPPLWQREFFDHVLRAGESYDSKWRYVLENPVRAGLVERPEDWPFGGEVTALRL